VKKTTSTDWAMGRAMTRTALPVLLVLCGKRKRSRPSRAENLYTSPFFAAAREFATQHGFQWYVLSAKHGLLSPRAIVRPYDLSLRDLSSSERREWSWTVAATLKRVIPGAAPVVLLATKAYVNALRGSLRVQRIQSRFVIVDGTSALALLPARRLVRHRLAGIVGRMTDQPRRPRGLTRDDRT